MDGLARVAAVRVADRDALAITRAALPGRLSARRFLTLWSFIRVSEGLLLPILPGLAQPTGVGGAEMAAAARGWLPRSPSLYQPVTRIVSVAFLASRPRLGEALNLDSVAPLSAARYARHEIQGLEERSSTRCGLPAKITTPSWS